MRSVSNINKFAVLVFISLLLIPLAMVLTGSYLADGATHKKFSDALIGIGTAGLTVEGIIVMLFLFGG